MSVAKSSSARPVAGSSRKSRRNHRSRTELVPRLSAPWQRALMWAAWLLWVWLMWRNTASVSMGGMEFLGLFVAIAVTVLCRKYPQGVRADFIEEPEQMRGEFESRTNWPLVLIGAAILLGGIASTIRIITHLATGFATVKDVLNDIGVFIVEWIHERLSGGIHDGALEKTQAYILCLLVIPGLIMVLVCLTPLLHRGLNFRVEKDGSLSVKKRKEWETVQHREYPFITADGTSILFRESEDATPRLELPLWRVFSRDKGTAVKTKVLAAWFRKELEAQGYTVESRNPNGMVETSWIARLKQTAAAGADSPP